jgi:hypothetical protein
MAAGLARQAPLRLTLTASGFEQSTENMAIGKAIAKGSAPVNARPIQLGSQSAKRLWRDIPDKVGSAVFQGFRALGIVTQDQARQTQHIGLFLQPPLSVSSRDDCCSNAKVSR